MRVKRLGVLLMGLSLLAMPSVSTASYILKLKNGRHITTSTYWKEGHSVVFEVEGGGTARVSEDAIASIEQRADEDATAVPKEPKRGKEAATSAERRPGEKKQIDVEAYRQRKDELKKEIDVVIEKYREAAGAQDEDAKQTIRTQMTDLAKQVFALEDELKKQNGGELPEGWQ